MESVSEKNKRACKKYPEGVGTPLTIVEKEY